MHTIKAWGAAAAGKPIEAMTIERREPGPRDVVIAIEYCGICHSDIHQARDEWGGSTFPMVPGHEIVGRVTKVGGEVRKVKEGDRAGVGCMVDSCRQCSACTSHHEQYCEKRCAVTYNGTEMDRKTRTFGGYSLEIVVDEGFVLRVPDSLDPAGAAPLLCAGITTYSPLRQFGVKAGDHVGVVGLGGLGHMAVKLAASMGAKVTVFSTTEAKAADAKRLGASDFVATKNPDVFSKLTGKFDLIIDTVSAEHDYNAYLGCLRARGEMILVGAPPEATKLHAFALIGGGKTMKGSMIGGIQETQEMLDHCAKHGVVSDIELIGMDKVNEAYDRVVKSDVRYRFVIDMAALRKSA